MVYPHHTMICLNETMESTQDKYTSPVPVLGLYIAAANMVCFLLIFCDVCVGFRHKKYWFPCRLFSINSITLTLIPIAARIPVDLTSSMPRKQDQLSKLFGTTFICVTMCFMLPSVVKNTEFESYANVIALSIFVITVVVNVCIQMATGVIFNFIPEHTIILMFMLFLLMRFWMSVTNMNVYKNDFSDVSKDMIRKGKGNMVARLRNCYLYAYHSCPQLYACRHASMGDADAVGLMSALVLVLAGVRSFISEDLRFCKGMSDYKWSIWVLLATQGFTLALISIPVGSRWLIVISHFTDIFNEEKDITSNETYLPYQYILAFRKVPSFVERSFRILIFIPLYIANFFIMAFDMCLHSILVLMCQCFVIFLCCGITHREDPWEEDTNEFIDLLKSYKVTVVDWALEKGLVDMQKWIEKHEKVTLKQLNILLSAVAPSQESAYRVGPNPNGEGIQISALSMMLLVEMAKLENPQDNLSLKNVLAEVFEIILFIDNRLNTGSSNDRLRSRLAAVMDKYGPTSGADEIFFEKARDPESGKYGFIAKRNPTCRICDEDGRVESCIHGATSQVSNFISYPLHETKTVVYGRIKQVFVDMLQAFFAQLPLAVCTHILESPVEEYEDRVRLGLDYMSKIQSVQSHMRFSLPPGLNFTSLFHTETPAPPAATTQVESTQGHGVSTPSPTRVPAVKIASKIQAEAQATMEEV